MIKTSQTQVYCIYPLVPLVVQCDAILMGKQVVKFLQQVD